MMPGGDLTGTLLLGGLFMLLLAVAEGWARLGHPNPEWTRKLVHIGGGVICLFFPFFIRSPWVVLVMCLLLTGLFALGGKTNALRALHGVKRRSKGAEYYPLAVTLVFAMAVGRPWLYVTSILVLAVADAAAALVGSSYGRIRYEVDGSTKSLEGSLSFMVIAFLAIHIPLLLMTPLSREICLLAALLVAGLVTGFEAISVSGLDNLFVPIGVCAILARITTKPVPEVVFQIASVLILFVAITLFARKARSFNTGGTIMCVLFVYGAWSLGSPHWALPILLALLLYFILWNVAPPPGENPPQVRVRILFRALVIPLLLLVIGNATRNWERMYAPFMAAWTVVTVLAVGRHLVLLAAQRDRHVVAAAAATLGFGTVALVTWIFVPTADWKLLALVLLLVIAAALIRLPRIQTRDVSREEHFWSAPELALTFAAALVVFVLQQLSWFGTWCPSLFSFPDGFT